MIRPSLLVVALVLPVSAGCGVGPDSASPARLDALDSANGRPALGSLHSRDRVLTFRGGPDGPRFTVRSTDGRLIAADLSIDQLAAQEPDLVRSVRGYAASGPAGAAKPRGLVTTGDDYKPLLLAD